MLIFTVQTREYDIKSIQSFFSNHIKKIFKSFCYISSLSSQNLVTRGFSENDFLIPREIYNHSEPSVKISYLYTNKKGHSHVCDKSQTIVFPDSADVFSVKTSYLGIIRHFDRIRLRSRTPYLAIYLIARFKILDSSS